VRLAAPAVRARATGGQPVDDDPVAGRQIVHALPHIEDVTRRLVPEHRRYRLRQAAVARGQVGVAHPRGAYPDPHLARPGPDDLNVIPDVELVVADRVEYRGSHGASHRCPDTRTCYRFGPWVGWTAR
jgi:hypothetical protein